MNLLIREEYSKSKEKEEAAIEEAAMEWLKSNVIPLNEAVDRKVLSDLISLIQKFDEKLSPYGQKLPTIMAIIANAENELNQVVTGNSHYRSKKRTGELLQSLTGTYNHLSDIMRNKIKLILAAPLFKKAREFEDLPLKAIEGLDYEMIFSAFKQAMKPTTLQQKLWGKIISKAQYDQMCKEFCDLSYKDLMSLVTAVPKIPVVVSTPINSEPEIPEEQPSEVTSVGLAAEGAPLSSIASEPAQQKDAALIPNTPGVEMPNPNGVPEIPNNTIKEQLDPKTQQLMAQSAGVIANLVRSIHGKGFEKTEPHLQALLKQIRAEIQMGKPGNALKQAEQVINIFNAIKNSVPKLNQLFADGDFDAEDVEFVKTLLTKAAQNAANAAKGGLGIVDKFAGRVAPFPGLDAASIVGDLLDSVQGFASGSSQQLSEQQEEQQADQGTPPEAQQQQTQVPAETPPQKNLLSVKQFFAALQQALTVGLKAPTTQQQKATQQQQAPAVAQNVQTQQQPQKTVDSALDELAKMLKADPGQMKAALYNAGFFGNVKK